MKINYSDEPVAKPNGIFLAGPTPRDMETPSWRPEALAILKKLGFEGVVYVPEHKNRISNFDYNTQVEWEWTALHAASRIIFWVPRRFPEMKGLTTNVEFGFYLNKSFTIYGRPEWAEKKGYLDWLYKKVTGRDPQVTLERTLIEALTISYTPPT